MTKKGCPSGSHHVKGKCRSIKKMKYHGREGNPVIHISDTGRKYIMVRHPLGKGTKRLYLVNGNIPKKHRK